MVDSLDRIRPDECIQIVGEFIPKSITFYCATALSLISFVCLLVSLTTPNWIEADSRLYNNNFDKLGLWVFCFRSFTDPKRRYPQYFASCRWFFDYEWKFMYDVLAPSFFKSVQATFCIGFGLAVASMTFLALLWINHYAPERQAELRYITSFGHVASGFWIFVSYSIFGANAYNPQWLPGWQNNYLSWSFAICVIGGLQMSVGSILYFWDAKNVQKLVLKRKELNTLKHTVSTNVPNDPAETFLESDPAADHEILFESDV